ncbi:MAG: hypothetical protein Q9181_000085 [Wetmoreana brouardii]
MTGPLKPATSTGPTTPTRPPAQEPSTGPEVEGPENDTTDTMRVKRTLKPKTPMTPPAEEKLSWDRIVPRPYLKKYQLPGSASSGSQELGHGAWSTVHSATEILQIEPSPLPSPPTSPASSPGKSVKSRVLAVKAPARRDAHDILYHEARILTYLQSIRCASKYIVPFHGYDTVSQSLIMDAVPLNLETYAKSCLQNARASFSTRTMFNPVSGSQEWQSLASQLISGLEFLHRANCVHGDIKPANILLQRNAHDSPGLHTPLYCDFSSSRILDSSTSNSVDQISSITAITPDFAAPELFTSLFSTTAVATTPSDVYALGVTLLVAAIGASPYAGASLELQKLSMAREGRPLEFARQAEQGTRAMKGKLVEQCLKGALEKNVKGRSTAEGWKRDFEGLIGCTS